MLLAVAEAPAFTLSVNLPAGQKVLEIPQGGEVQVTVKVTRKPPPSPQQKPETKDSDKGKNKPDAKDADKGKKKPSAKEEPMPRIFFDGGQSAASAGREHQDGLHSA